MSTNQRPVAEGMTLAVVLRVGVIENNALALQFRVPVDRPLFVDGDGLADRPTRLRVLPSEDGPVLRVLPPATCVLDRNGQRTVVEDEVRLQAGDRVRVHDGARILLLQPVFREVPRGEPLPSPGSFRPLLWEAGDPLYASMLAMVTSVVAVAWMWALSVGPLEEVGPVVLPDRVARVFTLPAPPPVAPLPTLPAADSATRVKEATPPPANVPMGALAKSGGDRRSGVVARSRVLGALGRLDGWLAGGADDSLLAGALDAVDGKAVIAAKGSEGMHAGYGHGGRVDAAVDLGPRPDGPPVRELKATVSVPRLPKSAVAAASSQSDVSDVVAMLRSRYSASVLRCYERRLKENPRVAGRVALAFDVENGRVVAASVVENRSGDDALATCIEQAALRWRFSDEATGTVEVPFTFQTD